MLKFKTYMCTLSTIEVKKATRMFLIYIIYLKKFLKVMKHYPTEICTLKKQDFLQG